MSIAEFLLDDPINHARLMGLDVEDVLGEDFAFSMPDTSTNPQEFDTCKRLPWARAFPTLILDDSDSFHYSTPELLGKGRPDNATLAAFWKASGAVRADIENERLVMQLIKSKVFTSVVISGDVHRSEQSFKNSILPLLRSFVDAGGILVVQNGARWFTYMEAFADEIKWTSGKSARGFGVHERNRQQVLRLFPEHSIKTQQIRGKVMSFYVKGALLKHVPDGEACFSSVEEGYPAKENVIVATKPIKKGWLLYVGTYNMYDSKHLLVDFLQENAISRKQFHMNCADIGLWQAEVALRLQSLQALGCRHVR